MQPIDPVDQEIMAVRQKLLGGGTDSFTDKDWQFLLAYWTGAKLEKLAQSVEVLTFSPIFANKGRVQGAVKMATPATIGAGILAVLLQILDALK